MAVWLQSSLWILKNIILQTLFLCFLPTGPFLMAEVCGRDLDCASDETWDESTTAYKQWNRVKEHVCLFVCSFACLSSCTLIYPFVRTGKNTHTQKAPTSFAQHVAITTQKKWKQSNILPIPEMNFDTQGACNTKNVLLKIYYH